MFVSVSVCVRAAIVNFKDIFISALNFQVQERKEEHVTLL